MSKLQVKIVNKNAYPPAKGHISDIGWDLIAISKVKELGKYTTMYDTGIAICPPVGYYTQIIPRSSIVNTGYVLTNSIGLIDPNYRGTLKICLTKIDHTKPDLKVPFKLTQLLIHKSQDIDIIKVQELTDTDRGEGGFGSTN